MASFLSGMSEEEEAAVYDNLSDEAGVLRLGDAVLASIHAALDAGGSPSYHDTMI